MGMSLENNLEPIHNLLERMNTDLILTRHTYRMYSEEYQWAKWVRE